MAYRYAFIALFLGVVIADDRCCYKGCSQKPTSCNNPGEYCNSESTCGGCGGEWCPDAGPSPPTPTPIPTPTPPPSPSPEGLTLYCPTASDMNSEHGNVQFINGGWKQTGDARVSSKTSWNLLGGYIEFDMDVSEATAGTNTNIYTVSMPMDNCGESCYCDIQNNGSPICMELDIIEANGQCYFASTWHTVPGFNGGGCDAGGCAYDGALPGTNFHMKSVWSDTGDWLTYMDDQPLHVNNYEKNTLSDADRQVVMDTMNNVGAAIESSQWQGWVPGTSCPGGGDLASSSFSISNLRVYGRVSHGPEPTRCAGEMSV